MAKLSLSSYRIRGFDLIVEANMESWIEDFESSIVLQIFLEPPQQLDS